MWVKDGEELQTTCKNCGVAVLPPDHYCKSCADKKLTGIGGWLFLPAIGLVLGILANAYSIIHTWGLTRVIYEEPLRTALYLETAGFAVLFLLLIYTTYLFFNKKRQLPQYYIALLLSLFAFIVADIWGTMHFLNATFELTDAWELLKSIIHLAIWIPYFCVSKRVKLTFVN